MSSTRFSRTATAILAAMALSSAGAYANEGGEASNGGPANVPGDYRSIDSFEMAAAIWLREDGTYAYFLTVGALDETSEGTWRSDGKTVHFTTLPKPVPPEFQMAPRNTEADAPFLIVTSPKGRGFAGIHFDLQCGDGSMVSDFTQTDGWSPETECSNPQWIELWEPIYDLPPVRFDLKGQGGGLHFILVPNSLGIVDFTDKQATLEEDVLTVPMREGYMKFLRTIPKQPASTPDETQQ